MGKIFIQNRFLTFEDFSLKLSASGLACGTEKGESVKRSILLTFFCLENQKTEVKQSKSRQTQERKSQEAIYQFSLHTLVDS